MKIEQGALDLPVLNNDSYNRPMTIFCDIDGTLVEHNSVDISCNPDLELKVLPNVIEKLKEWEFKGYRIILTTGRKKSLRKATIKQLRRAGIFYDQLIMGIGGGYRVLINDKKPDGNITAFSFSPDRNFGLEDIDI